MKYTAGQIATELRRIADALDKEPETELKQPHLSFYNWENKEQFLATARLLPRPLKKEVTEHEYVLRGSGNAVVLRTSADRSAVCTIITPAQPAVYDCMPLLNAVEEESLQDA